MFCAVVRILATDMACHLDLCKRMYTRPASKAAAVAAAQAALTSPVSPAPQASDGPLSPTPVAADAKNASQTAPTASSTGPAPTATPPPPGCAPTSTSGGTALARPHSGPGG